MGLWDGLGANDDRRAAAKKQERAILQEQIAEQQRSRAPQGSRGQGRLEPAYAAPQQPNYGWSPPPQPGWSPAPQPSYAQAAPFMPPTAPAWPWQAGGAPPLQAWRSPPPAMPHGFFPRPQAQAQGWQHQQMRPQVDEVIWGRDAGPAAAHRDPRMPPISRPGGIQGMPGPGAGRGVAQPVGSARGGWLHPQMRSEMDSLIYGHDLDGYDDGNPGHKVHNPPGRGPPGRTPVQQSAPPHQRPASSGQAQIDIDAEWADWERNNPRRRRANSRAEPGEHNQAAQAQSPPPPSSARDSRNHHSNAANAAQIDIDAEWAQWEANNPQFKKRQRHKRTESEPSNVSAPPPMPSNTSVPMSTPASPASASVEEGVQTSDARSPKASVTTGRPPLHGSPPRAPVAESPYFMARPPAPSSVRSGGLSRISEDLRSSAAPSLNDEFRSIRRSCSDQRALLHSQVEQLKAEASRLLAQEAKPPSLSVLGGRSASENRPFGMPSLLLPSQSPSPLLQVLEEQRRLARAPAPARPLHHGGSSTNNSDLSLAELRMTAATSSAASPERLLPELKLSAAMAENKRRASLPALPDYPVHTFKGTLREASTFIFPDAFAQSSFPDQSLPVAQQQQQQQQQQSSVVPLLGKLDFAPDSPPTEQHLQPANLTPRNRERSFTDPAPGKALANSPIEAETPKVASARAAEATSSPSLSDAVAGPVSTDLGEPQACKAPEGAEDYSEVDRFITSDPEAVDALAAVIVPTAMVNAAGSVSQDVEEPAASIYAGSNQISLGAGENSCAALDLNHMAQKKNDTFGEVGSSSQKSVDLDSLAYSTDPGTRKFTSYDPDFGDITAARPPAVPATSPTQQTPRDTPRSGRPPAPDALPSRQMPFDEALGNSRPLAVDPAAGSRPPTVDAQPALQQHIPFGSAPDGRPAPEEAHFTSVIRDLGAELRKAASSGASAEEGGGNETLLPSGQGSAAISEITAVPATSGSEASPDTTRKALPMSCGSTGSKSPKSLLASPGRILTRPSSDDSTDGVHGRRSSQDETESEGGRQNTQLMLMSVLMAETQAQGSGTQPGSES